MFIGQTTTSTAASNKSYFTYRLVSSVRIGKKVSQKTLLNLGRHFDVERELWPELCTRVEQILAGECALFVVASWSGTASAGNLRQADRLARGSHG